MLRSDTLSTIRYASTLRYASRLLRPRRAMVVDALKVKRLPQWYETGELKPSETIAEGVTVDEELNGRIAIWQGDITTLSIDAIQNAANRSLLGGGGIDGAIHRAAGDELYDECETLNGAETSDAKITKGYNLPADHVIHAVGPIYSSSKGEENARLLRSVYQRTLEVAVENGCRSVAFNCISTGIYGYPNRDAAHIALRAVRDFLLGKDGGKIELALFCIVRRPLGSRIDVHSSLTKISRSTKSLRRNTSLLKVRRAMRPSPRPDELTTPLYM